MWKGRGDRINLIVWESTIIRDSVQGNRYQPWLRGPGFWCRLEKLLIRSVSVNFGEKGSKGRMGLVTVRGDGGEERLPVPLISAAQVLEMQLCLECC